MPRKDRIDAFRALHRIILRGIDRRKIFLDDSDRSMIWAKGCDVDWLLERVTGIFGLTAKQVSTGGKQRKTVKACSVSCDWGTRELGMSAVGISRKTGQRLLGGK